jgi:uncharacterized protein (TIGR01777 family)
MATVLITGGTGLIGKHLTKMLVSKGYDVIILTRQPLTVNRCLPSVSYAKWDLANQIVGADAITKADYIIHLAGASVAEKRWTVQRKQEIINSRTQSSALIVKALKEIPNAIKAVISTSAIGWYGADDTNSLQNGFKEDAKADNEFLGKTCRLWEESIEPVKKLNKRLIKLRIGIVLSKDGGALKEFIKPLQMGVAAILGNGKQMISWIHIEDVCRLFIHAMENENMQGVFNAVAPNPVNNKILTLTLAKQRNKFFIPFYVPAFVLKIMLGEMSIEVLKSANVSAAKTQSTGFNFNYTTIAEALRKEVSGEMRNEK